MSDSFVPVCEPYLTGKEKEYVTDALDTGWISSAGSYLTRFEERFARLVDCEFGVSCSNGTAAVYIALQACGVGKGDRVVVPTFTMMASIFPLIHLGAQPVLVDCDRETWTLDTRLLNDLSGSFKAILPVHIYGHPCEMDAISKWAESRDALVIEDAAEGIGSRFHDRPCGSFGKAASFSFYANKVLTCGEGGMVTTNCPKVAERARYYRNVCFDPDPRKRFIHDEVGHNFRLTNLQAAVGLAQVEHAEDLIQRRRSMGQVYLERLKHLGEFLQLPVEMPQTQNSYWMFGVVLKDSVGFGAAQACDKLAELGVGTRRFFCPAHLQPGLKAYLEPVHAPESERLWERGFYLPSSSNLTSSQVDQVVKAMETLLGV